MFPYFSFNFTNVRRHLQALGCQVRPTRKGGAPALGLPHRKRAEKAPTEGGGGEHPCPSFNRYRSLEGGGGFHPTLSSYSKEELRPYDLRPFPPKGEKCWRKVMAHTGKNQGERKFQSGIQVQEFSTSVVAAPPSTAADVCFKAKKALNQRKRKNDTEAVSPNLSFYFPNESALGCQVRVTRKGGPYRKRAEKQPRQATPSLVDTALKECSMTGFLTFLSQLHQLAVTI